MLRIADIHSIARPHVRLLARHLQRAPEKNSSRQGPGTRRRRGFPRRTRARRPLQVQETSEARFEVSYFGGSTPCSNPRSSSTLLKTLAPRCVPHWSSLRRGRGGGGGGTSSLCTHFFNIADMSEINVTGDFGCIEGCRILGLRLG